MRVLHFVATTEAQFFDQQVAALEERGIDCTTLAVSGGDGSGTSKSVVDYLRFCPTGIRESLGSYDLVHANFGLTAPPAVAQRRLPVVVSLWGTDVYGRYGWVSKLASPFADAVVVMSDRMRRAYGRECRVIPHGVDLNRFSPAPRGEAKAELGWDESVNHVLFPYSRGRPVKNYPLARRVVSAAEDRLDERVTLQTVTGVPHERMATYMNAANALLLTSRWEGSPNAVKEAMACNLSVVSTDVGDVAERVADDPHSHVCAREEELVDRLVETLSRGGRSRGREAVRDVSLERTSSRLVDTYRSVLSTETRSTTA